ncbi:hypothetical protein V8F33_006115 [Rhypophila sp. PSN 637]
MDPVSAAASVTGIILFATKIVSELISIVDHVKNGGKRFETILSHLRALQDLLEKAKALTLFWESEAPNLPCGLGQDIYSTIGEVVRSCSQDIERMLRSKRLSTKRAARALSILDGSKTIEQWQANILTHYQIVNNHLAICERIKDEIRSLALPPVNRSIAVTERNLSLHCLFLKILKNGVSNPTCHAGPSTQVRVSEFLKALAAYNHRNARTNGGNSLSRRSRQSTCGACGTIGAACVVAPGRGSTDNYWSCGAALGVDQGFADNRCIFCAREFHEIGSTFRSRAKHLVRSHQWGHCHSLDTNYSNWKSMSAHLQEHHRVPRDLCLQNLMDTVFLARSPRGETSRSQRSGIGSADPGHPTADLSPEDQAKPRLREKLDCHIWRAIDLCKEARSADAPFLTKNKYSQGHTDADLAAGLQDLYVQSCIYAGLGDGPHRELIETAFAAAGVEQSAIVEDDICISFDGSGSEEDEAASDFERGIDSDDDGSQDEQSSSGSGGSISGSEDDEVSSELEHGIDSDEEDSQDEESTRSSSSSGGSGVSISGTEDMSESEVDLIWPVPGARKARVWTILTPRDPELRGRGDDDSPCDPVACYGGAATLHFRRRHASQFLHHLRDIHNVSVEKEERWLDLERFWRRRWALWEGSDLQRIQLWIIGCFIESWSLRTTLRHWNDYSEETLRDNRELGGHRLTRFGAWENKMLTIWMDYYSGTTTWDDQDFAEDAVSTGIEDGYGDDFSSTCVEDSDSEDQRDIEGSQEGEDVGGSGEGEGNEGNEGSEGNQGQ